MQCNNMGGLKAPKRRRRGLQQAARAAIRETRRIRFVSPRRPKTPQKTSKTPKKQNRVNERDPARRIAPDPPGPKRDAN